MHFNPVALKVVINSVARIDEASACLEKTTKCIEESLDAVANLEVAASKYRASKKFILPPCANKPLYKKFKYLLKMLSLD